MRTWSSPVVSVWAIGIAGTERDSAYKPFRIIKGKKAGSLPAFSVLVGYWNNCTQFVANI